MKYSKLALGATALILFAAMPEEHPPGPFSIKKLHFLGESDVPHKKAFKGTTIGGLSGIDYDAKHGLYYLISDDRSAINPARFYTAKIHISATGIDSIQFENVFPFLQANGKIYPSFKQDPLHTPDPEAIRYNAVTEELVWSSEGERIVKENNTVIQDPSLTIINTTGHYVESVQIPSNTKMQSIEKGPRQNGGFEGMTFTPDYKSLLFNVELPLYEDGPEPSAQLSNSWIRIFQYDVIAKKYTGQYAYQLDPVAFPPHPETAFKINGVPDVLSLGDGKVLTIERSFSTGRVACTIKVFITDLNGADNILEVASLKLHPPSHPARKKLLLNMDDLGIYTDNIEGVTFGPDLPNGHRTLVFVSDDNFQPFEKTQFLLFEVIPE